MNLRSVCCHRAEGSLGRSGGVAHMNGALPGMDTRYLGRAGWGGRSEGQSCPLPEREAGMPGAR